MSACWIIYKLMRRQVHSESQTIMIGTWINRNTKFYKYINTKLIQRQVSVILVRSFNSSIYASCAILRILIMSSRHTAAWCCNNKEQHVLPWFMLSRILQNNLSCHDSCDQRYQRTARPAMVHVISDIKEQHVLPWFMWYQRTARPAMVHVISNIKEQHVLPWFMWYQRTARPAIVHVISDIKEQHVLPWFVWSVISKNSTSCRDSCDQEYYRTTCPVMIHVISYIKEQHVLPWFVWSVISKNSTSCRDSCDQEYYRTTCPAMIHVISDIKEQHVLPWFV